MSLCLTDGNLDGFECVTRYLRGKRKESCPSHEAGARGSAPEAGGNCPQFSELEATTSLYFLGGMSQSCDADSPLLFVEGQGVNIFRLRSSVSYDWILSCVMTQGVNAHMCCS